jgi:hypothetical protein
MIHYLGNLEPFFPEGSARSERAEFGMAHSERGRSKDGGKDKLTKALTVPRLVEQRHGLLETVNRPTIITLRLVDKAEGLIRQRLCDDIPTGPGERQGALGSSEGLAIGTHPVEIS